MDLNTKFNIGDCVLYQRNTLSKYDTIGFIENIHGRLWGVLYKVTNYGWIEEDRIITNNFSEFERLIYGYK